MASIKCKKTLGVRGSAPRSSWGSLQRSPNRWGGQPAPLQENAHSRIGHLDLVCPRPLIFRPPGLKYSCYNPDCNWVEPWSGYCVCNVQGVRRPGCSLASVYRSALTQRVSVCYQCKHTRTAACCSRGASDLLATNSSCVHDYKRHSQLQMFGSFLRSAM